MAIYLDYNATAPLRPEAAEAMQAAMGPPSNPSSIHSYGRKARLAVEEARQQVAMLLGVRHADLVFTSGGTEANNMVLRGFETCIISEIEHDAVLAVRPDAIKLAVSADGVVLPETLETCLVNLSEVQRSSCLVSIMAANNETGVIQPLDALAKICAQYNVPMHSDMVQAAGKLPINPADIGLSFASLSAHKLGGPGGVGALWIKPGLTLPSLLVGGGQEQGRRSGTENTLGIIGFGAAAEASARQNWREIEVARDAAITVLAAEVPDIKVLGVGAPRLANTICLGLPKVRSETIVMALDLKGFAVSSGAACSSGKVQPSHVVIAMGETDLAGSIVRISAGWMTTPDELSQLAQTVIALYKQLAN